MIEVCSPKKNLDGLLSLCYHYIAARKMGARERLIIQETFEEEFTKAVVTTYSEEREIFLAEKMVDEKRWILCWNKRRQKTTRCFGTG